MAKKPKLNKDEKLALMSTGNPFTQNFKKNTSISNSAGLEMTDSQRLGLGLRDDIDKSVGGKVKYTTVSADYSVLPTDELIDCTGTVTLYLLSATKRTGKQYVIKNSGTGVVTIDADGSETIDGDLTAVMMVQYGSVTVVSNGANWIVSKSYIYRKTGGHIYIPDAHLGKGATAPDSTVLGNFHGWSFDINDDSIISIELPHALDSTYDLSVHVSWYINEAYATASGEVQWQLDYSLVPHDASETVSAPTDSGTLTTGDINIPTNANTVHHVTNLVIPAAKVTDGHDSLGVTLSRIALVGGVNPTADPVVIGVHIEYTTTNAG